MANVKQGQTVRPPQWWRHLRDWKRVFWRRQRRADRQDITRALIEREPRMPSGKVLYPL